MSTCPNLNKSYKGLVLLLSLSIFPFIYIQAQATFKIVSVIDTILESNSNMVVAKIVTSSPSPTSEQVRVSLKSGTANTLDFNGVININVIIPANTDTANFLIPVFDDYQPEFTEITTFVLRAVSPGASVSADSLFTIYIKDNDLPATIGFLIPNDTIWETQNSYEVKIVCYNPNPGPVRAFVRADDGNSTLTGGAEFTFFWTFYFFNPGFDTIIAPINLFDDFVQESLEFLTIKLSDFDANIVADSSFTIYIRDDESPQPLYASFVPSSDTVWEDTASFINVYMEFFNPTPFTYQIEVIRDNIKSTASPRDFFGFQKTITLPPGFSRDSTYINVVNDSEVENTEIAVMRFRYPSENLSPDSLFELTIIDKDTVQIGFLGAAFSYLENQGKCAVKLITSSPMPYDISVPITYVEGNATPGVDFSFNDTIIIFPAFSADTQMVYITIIDDVYKEINEQVILQMGTPSDPNAKNGIQQFSFFIIDNDTFALSIGEIDISSTLIIYPIPFTNSITIESEQNIESVILSDLTGKILFVENNISQRTYSISNLDIPSSSYILDIRTKEGRSKKSVLKL
jgi:hypothetical protein